jgi:uncharacterized protein with GYD domain
MPRYMLQFAYTSEAWSSMIRKPVDRTKTIQALASSLGGEMIDLYYTSGEFDGFVIAELPNDVAAMSFILRAIGAGHVKATKTTRLMTAREAKAAMAKASEEAYSGPK